MKGSLKSPVWLAIAAAAVMLALLGMQGGTADSASQQEKRIADVLSAMAGAGRVEVALFYAAEESFSVSSASVPTGALVVAEGAGDMAVRLNLIRAVRTLLGLPENAVDVFVMEGEP